MNMKSTKKVFLTLSMLFVGFLTFAQIGVSGTVIDTNGQGVPNVLVTLEDSLSGTIVTTTTDAIGNYYDTLNVNATQGYVVAYITDCTGNYLFGYAAYSPFMGVNIDFTYCANSGGGGNPGGGGGGTPGCSASFWWNYAGAANTIVFYPDSTGPNLSYSWDINGVTYTSASPTVTMSSSQPASVCLTVTNSALNCSDTYCDTINFWSVPCNSAFTPTSNPSNPYVFDFTPVSTSTALNYMWDFGDGNTSTQLYPTHTYSSSGQYSVCLTVSNPNGSCSTTTCNTVVVQTSGGGNNLCDATFGQSNAPNSPMAYWFYPMNYSSSLIYSWDFGDGNFSSIATPLHTYTMSGTYTVTLAVFDPATGCTDTASTPVTIGGLPTSCSAHFYPVNSGVNTISFVNLSTSGAGTTYNWDFGDGGTSTQMYPTHTYQPTPANNTFNVCLTVTTASGCVDSICMPVTVQSQSGCQSTFTAYADTNNYLTTYFNAQSVNPGFSTGYFWDFGDGNNAVGQNVTHTYAQDGLYIVTLATVDSLNNCSSVYVDTLTVDSNNIMNVTINFFNTGGNTVQLSTQVTFGGNKRSGNEMDNMRFHWDFGNGSVSTVPNPVYTFPQSGMHNVCVTLTNESGYSTTYCQDVEATLLNVAEVPSELKYALYPVPASDQITMEWNEDSNATLKVYNLQGQLVWTGSVSANSGKNNIDVSQLSGGIYVMHIQTSNIVRAQRFVIE